MENGTPQVEIGLARNGNRPFKNGFILFEDSPPQAAGNVQL